MSCPKTPSGVHSQVGDDRLFELVLRHHGLEDIHLAQQAVRLVHTVPLELLLPSCSQQLRSPPLR